MGKFVSVDSGSILTTHTIIERIIKHRLVFHFINHFTAVYKCTQYAGGKYGYFDVMIVLHIISYKIIMLPL